MIDAPPPSVGHTCTAIDRAIKWACAEGLGGSALVSALEQIRTENTALRRRLAWFEMQYQGTPNE